MEKIVNIPNGLSLFRILLIPFFVYSMLNGEYTLALIIFILGPLSDGLDGIIARKFNQMTKFGKTFDLVADLSFFLAVFFMVIAKQLLPLWILLVGIAVVVVNIIPILIARKKYSVSSPKYVKYASIFMFPAGIAIIINLIYKEIIVLVAIGVYLVLSLHLLVETLRKRYNKVFG